MAVGVFAVNESAETITDVSTVIIVILTVSIARHAPEVPITVYVVFTVGVATGLAIFVRLSPVDGLHVYVVAPPRSKRC